MCRHAKSAWPAELSDFERPLNERGLRDAPAAGRWLQENTEPADLTLCSPATRARKTWRLVSAELDAEVQARYDKRIYGATAGQLIELANELPDSARTVVFVGHNPGLEELVTALTGTAQELKTCSIAVIAGDSSWSEVEPGWGRLASTATPRG
ncbi:histidine phosphatase family protein [Parasphingorhabdus pacifica]